MNFLSNQIRFTSSLKGNVFVGVILGLFLSAIIILLEPFDTNQYRSDYKILFLLGFGIVFGCAYFIYSWLERMRYHRINKLWLVRHELTSIFIFFLFSGTLVYLYNRLIINEGSYSIGSHWWYLTHIVLAMIPIITPVLVYLRQKTGERIVPTSPEIAHVIGANKREELVLENSQLIYVQANQNYIEIVYINSDKKTESKTFRQSLSKIHQQAPFLERCHRSFLVNVNSIQEIKGNSQNAKIYFRHAEGHIPLSKTFYRNIKVRLK